MKITKKWLTLPLVFVIAVFVVAAFLPSTFKIQRSIWIDASIENTFDKVADLNQWREWSPWTEIDVDASYMIEGQFATPGMKMAWRGPKIGVGSLTIVDVSPPLELVSVLRFEGANELTAQDKWTFEEQNDGTQVVWSNEMKLKYPFERYLQFFLEDELAPTFERGLSNLKRVLENSGI